jgi:hypothetical protein
MRHCATAFATGFTRVRRLFERPVQRYPALNRLFCSRLSGPCLSQAHPLSKRALLTRLQRLYLHLSKLHHA